MRGGFRDRGAASLGVDVVVLAVIGTAMVVARRRPHPVAVPAAVADRERRRSRRVAWWVPAGVAVVLFVAAGAVTAATWPSPISRGVVPRPPLPSGLAAPSLPSAPARVAPRAGSVPVRDVTALPVIGGPLVSGPLRPMRLIVPRLGVDAAVLPEVVSGGGSLGVPDDPMTLGWWSSGPEPGAKTGTAVIDGHVDSAVLGLGALFHLQDAVPGDRLAVVGTAGSELFTVDAVRQYPKSTLAAAGVFDQSLGGRLVIVTCGGPFNETTHTYRDNVVVYATPTAGQAS